MYVCVLPDAQVLPPAVDALSEDEDEGAHVATAEELKEELDDALSGKKAHVRARHHAATAPPPRRHHTATAPPPRRHRASITSPPRPLRTRPLLPHGDTDRPAAPPAQAISKLFEKRYRSMTKKKAAARRPVMAPGDISVQRRLAAMRNAVYAGPKPRGAAGASPGAKPPRRLAPLTREAVEDA